MEVLQQHTQVNNVRLPSNGTCKGFGAFIHVHPCLHPEIHAYLGAHTLNAKYTTRLETGRTHSMMPPMTCIAPIPGSLAASGWTGCTRDMVMQHSPIASRHTNQRYVYICFFRTCLLSPSRWARFATLAMRQVAHSTGLKQSQSDQHVRHHSGMRML